MKSFSAQYIITNSGPPLKRGIITTDDDGKILNVKDTKGSLEESRAVEFYNGVIVPGFVNCHCHLELSHMKGAFSSGKGLGSFIEQIRKRREAETEEIILRAKNADNDMLREGIVLCADICNTSNTFGIKKESRINYFNLLEVFGIDQSKADKRMKELYNLGDSAGRMNLEYSFVPHSVYSISLPLARLLREETQSNKVTSIHFMESDAEVKFLSSHTGPLMESYQRSELLPRNIEIGSDHSSFIFDYVTSSGNLILVHNTFADNNIIRKINKRENVFWCLCPGSNIFIENKIPPLDILLEEKCSIVIGTDSLASNDKLSILNELKILQQNFPEISLIDLIKWSTINGARALGKEEQFGKIEADKNPGLLLLDDVDLVNMKILPESKVKRLI